MRPYGTERGTGHSMGYEHGCRCRHCRSHGRRVKRIYNKAVRAVVKRLLRREEGE